MKKTKIRIQTPQADLPEIKQFLSENEITFSTHLPFFAGGVAAVLIDFTEGIYKFLLLENEQLLRKGVDTIPFSVVHLG